MKVQSKSNRLIDRTAPALRTEARLSFQHTRWLLSEYPDYLWKERARGRRISRLSNGLKNRFAAFKEKNPAVFWFGDLLLIALTIVFFIGGGWWVFEGIMLQRAKAATVNGISIEDLKPVFNFLGWMPPAIATAHLFTLWIFWSDPLRKFPRRIRHLVLTNNYRWIAMAMVLLYAVPIGFAATSPTSFLAAMILNVLMVNAIAVAVQQVGVGLISRRSTYLLHDQKRYSKHVAIWTLPLLPAMLGFVILASFICRRYDFQPELPLGFMQDVAAGNASAFWIFAAATVSAVSLLIAWQVRGRRRTFAFKRRIVRRLRFDAKAPVETLSRMLGDESSISFDEFKQAIEAEMKASKSTLLTCLKRIVRFDALLWICILFILTVYGLVGPLLVIIGQSDPEVRQAASTPAVEVVLTSCFFMAWFAIESLDWLREWRNEFRPSEARPIAPLKCWTRLQADGMATYMQATLLALPLLAIVIWFLRDNAIVPVAVALLAVLMAQVAARNIGAVLKMLMPLRSLMSPLPIPQWLMTPITLLCMFLFMLLLIGIAAFIREFGNVGLMVTMAGATILSFVGLASSVAYRNSLMRPVT